MIRKENFTLDEINDMTNEDIFAQFKSYQDCLHDKKADISKLRQEAEDFRTIIRELGV